jgi:chromosomal replication initiation ATPase DnaA
MGLGEMIWRKKTMSEQLIFDLPIKTAFGREDFFVTSANTSAVQIVENWPKWPMGKLVLAGPSGAGKSHLAHIWSEMTGGMVIDARALMDVDLQEVSQAALCVENMHLVAGSEALEAHAFHLHNLAQETGAPLLMTGLGVPASWGIQLADLNSRIQGTSLAELRAPDDALLNALLVKQFSDRQIAIDPKVVNFVLPRMERSFSGVATLVDALDKAALKAVKPISVKLARQILEL